MATRTTGAMGTEARSTNGLSRGRAVVLVAAVALVALNLRPAVVAIGPLASDIESDTALSVTAIGLLTTLPVVCFGAFGPVGPLVGRRIGLERAVAVALVLLIAGVVARLLSASVALFAGSLAVGVGIAMGNVLMPAVVKRHFGSRTGPTMAVYSVFLNGGAALAAGLTVPLRDGLEVDWRAALALWGVLAGAGLALWLAATARSARHPREDPAPPGVWRSSLAWAAAGFIGLQSSVFYALTAWVPTLLADAGLSEARAGLMLSLLALFGIAGGLCVPVLAARSARQRYLVAFVVATFGVGLAGLIVAPAELALLWMFILGLGQGSGIALALTLFVLRARSTAGATALSAMAQTVGYLIASLGPLLVGAVHELTDGWTVPMALLIATLVPLLRTGWAAGSDRTLEDETAAARA